MQNYNKNSEILNPDNKEYEKYHSMIEKYAKNDTTVLPVLYEKIDKIC